MRREVNLGVINQDSCVQLIQPEDLLWDPVAGNVLLSDAGAPDLFSKASHHLISHFPDVLKVEGILSNFREVDCIRNVPPVKPGPEDQP